MVTSCGPDTVTTLGVDHANVWTYGLDDFKLQQSYDQALAWASRYFEKAPVAVRLVGRATNTIEAYDWTWTFRGEHQSGVTVYVMVRSVPGTNSFWASYSVGEVPSDDAEVRTILNEQDFRSLDDPEAGFMVNRLVTITPEEIRDAALWYHYDVFPRFLLGKTATRGIQWGVLEEGNWDSGYPDQPPQDHRIVATYSPFDVPEFP